MAAINLAVSDLNEHVGGLHTRGFTPGHIQQANKGVCISTLEDPDGNTINLIGGFRVQY